LLTPFRPLRTVILPLSEAEGEESPHFAFAPSTRDSINPVPTPLTYWIAFHLALLALLAAELAYARRPVNQPPLRTPASARRTAIVATTGWLAAALAFGLFLHYTFGSTAAIQYLAGYALEQSLSVDNLFVFLLLFRLFRIDDAHQPKVLFWGVAGAILMRGLFIAGGLTLLARFTAVTYVFAAILLAAAIRLLIPSKPEAPDTPPRWIAWLTRLHPVSPSQATFFVVKRGRPIVTMLLLALIAIELTDIVFALDSIPAVLSITRNPFLAYTSNIMAVIGLRSLYFLLIGMLVRLRFLHYGLAAILAFAALKMLASRWIDLPPLASLAVILAVLTLTVAASLWPRKSTGADSPLL
jgi:tellurite resistance protein TerC